MLRMTSWARWVAVVILWFFVFVLVGGIINPYMASDMMSAGIVPPSVATLLAYIVPAVATIDGCYIISVNTNAVSSEPARR